jgi:N-acetylmuramoyl-L-alanine amidase
MIEIKEDFLTPSQYTRPGYKRAETLGVVLHWVAGRKKQTAKNIKDYFESLRKGPKYVSTQYVIGWQGEILRLMPDDERAYHVGHAGIVDPVSGKYYTDYARSAFGFYATNPKFSPSYCTIGIELCHSEDTGQFTKETLTSAKELCVYLFQKYKLDPRYHLTTHEGIVGWKYCPLWFHKHPEDFVDFNNGLTMALRGEK